MTVCISTCTLICACYSSRITNACIFIFVIGRTTTCECVCVHVGICSYAYQHYGARMHPYVHVRIPLLAWECLHCKTCEFSVEFSFIPKAQIQRSRCSFIQRGEYWAIWNCSYHSYWTIALIAARVWVHVSVKGVWGRDGNRTRPWETEQLTDWTDLHAYRCIFKWWFFFRHLE